VAWDFIPFSPALERVAREIDAVDFGTLGQRSPVSRETTLSFVALTRRDAIRLFDLNLRPPHYTREIIEKSLAAASEPRRFVRLLETGSHTGTAR